MTNKWLLPLEFELKSEKVDFDKLSEDQQTIAMRALKVGRVDGILEGMALGQVLALKTLIDYWVDKEKTLEEIAEIIPYDFDEIDKLHHENYQSLVEQYIPSMKLKFDSES
ncbi:hypothetical protein ACWOBE_02930 [Hutsoniella sourekii]